MGTLSPIRTLHNRIVGGFKISHERVAGVSKAATGGEIANGPRAAPEALRRARFFLSHADRSERNGRKLIGEDGGEERQITGAVMLARNQSRIAAWPLVNE